MSEWGQVIFYYDYEAKESKERVRGLVSRCYKYPGIIGLLQHGMCGYQYFMEHLEDGYLDREELNTAFDVNFEKRSIQVGIDRVAPVLEKEVEATKKELFNCEGTDGYLYITYTGNSRDGYKSKYGYLCGYATVEDSFMSAKAAGKIFFENYNFIDEEKIKIFLNDALFQAYENELELYANEDELYKIEDLGLAFVNESLCEQQSEAEVEKNFYSITDAIDELEFCVHTYLCLKRAKINTLGELIEIYKTENGLKQIKILGNKGIVEVKEKLDLLITEKKIIDLQD